MKILKWTTLAIGAMAVSLSACGGGDDDQTVSVAKQMAVASGVTQADGTLVLSLFPPPGASVAAQEALSKAGVAVLSKKCASQSGPGFATASGTPDFYVVFEINASDLAKAQTLDYKPVTPELQATFSPLYDCSSKSL